MCLLFLSLVTVACGKSDDPVSPEIPANLPAEPVTAPPLQQPRQSTAKPDAARPATDPKSAEAAREVLVGYASYLEGGELIEARRSWSDGSDPTSFETQLQQFERFQLDVGDAGRMEGAAGSSYMEFPLKLTGLAKNGEPLALSGTATLRRVNDVPGSTEVQRRWHIYRVELQPLP